MSCPRHPLIDATEPNLLEDVFNYSLPPLIRFDGLPVIEHIDGQRVEFDVAAAAHRDIFLTDTTFRDGQQSRPPYTIEQMVKIYDMLARLGGPNGVIRQTEFFLYTKNDRETLDRCRELGRRYPECIGWIRATMGDFRLVKECGLTETGLLTSCSDYHIFKKQKFHTRQQACDSYCEVVAAAFEAGVRPRCQLEDITRADIDGFVLPFVDRLMEMSRERARAPRPDHHASATRWASACTTPALSCRAASPSSSTRSTANVACPPSRLEWHGHNDFHRVHSNGATAWLYGCDALNATLFGFGERTGNSPLEGAIYGVHRPQGRPVRHRHHRHHRACRLHALDRPAHRRQLPVRRPQLQHAPAPASTPTACATTSASTTSLTLANCSIARRASPSPTRAASTASPSGSTTSLASPASDRISKIKVHKLARWVMDQYEVHGRLTAIGDHEMERQLRELMPDLCAKHNGSPAHTHAPSLPIPES